MKVCVLGYGRIWSIGAPAQRGAAAYFNTTGVTVHGKVKSRSSLYGYVRIDQYIGFQPEKATRSINRVYQTDGLCLWQGRRKLFLRKACPRGTEPDRYLVCISDSEIGKIDRRGYWLSEASQIISFSEGNDQQEALLLAPAFGWVRGAAGLFGLVPGNGRPWIASLERYGG